MIRFIYSMVLVLALAAPQVMAAATATPATTVPNQGVFTSVNGKVQIQKAGRKTRTAQKDSTVKEGDKIVAAKGSDAVIRFFDGTELTVSPETQFTISKLQKSSLQDKVIKFKLAFGKLLANVKKLASAKSSFEIEAGGVVCGVRGTKYSYSYDAVTNKVTVHVEEGTVYLNSNGQTYLFTAGQTGVFDNGKPEKPTNPDQSSNQGGKDGDKGNGDIEGTSSLADLNEQFKGGILIDPQNAADNNPISGNGNTTLTDLNVEGAKKITVQAIVGAGEAVP